MLGMSQTQPVRMFQTKAGHALPFTELGIGTAPLGNMYRALTEASAQGALQAGWDAGCRYIDTAPFYGLGLAETRINTFLRGRPRDGLCALHQDRPASCRLPAGGARRHRPVLRNALAPRRLRLLL